MKIRERKGEWDRRGEDGGTGREGVSSGGGRGTTTERVRKMEGGERLRDRGKGVGEGGGTKRKRGKR